MEPPRKVNRHRRQKLRRLRKDDVEEILDHHGEDRPHERMIYFGPENHAWSTRIKDLPNSDEYNPDDEE